MKEEWRSVRGYVGCYEVSNKGRVRSLTRKRRSNRDSVSIVQSRVLKESYLPTGYCFVHLSRNAKVKHFYIHRLVAATFIRRIKKGEQINHKDFNKKNNKITNLEIVTPKQNSHHAMKDGRGVTGKKGESNLTSKLTEEKVRLIRQKNEQGISQRILAKEFGVCFQNISFICLRKTWTHC